MGSLDIRVGGIGGNAGAISDGTTLQGTGTSVSPLALVPNGTAFDPASYFPGLFQAKTGLSPMSFWTKYEDFTDGNRSLTGSNGYGVATNSANGAGVTYHQGGDSGVLVLKSGATGSGFCDWSLSPGGTVYHVANTRTKRWMLAYRIASAAAPVAASRVAAGMYGGNNMIGLGYGAAVSTWRYNRAVNDVTSVADTGKAIDSSGNAYLWMYLFNDGIHLNYCIDVLGGAAQAVAEVSANLPNLPGYTYIWNEGTASGDIVNFDGFAFCVER